MSMPMSTDSGIVQVGGSQRGGVKRHQDSVKQGIDADNHWGGGGGASAPDQDSEGDLDGYFYRGNEGSGKDDPSGNEVVSPQACLTKASPKVM